MKGNLYNVFSASMQLTFNKISVGYNYGYLCSVLEKQSLGN